MSKRLLLINSVCGIGSTGRICADIAREYEQDGYEVKIAYGRSDVLGEGTEKYAVRIGSKVDVYAHVAYTRLFDKHGLASKRATKNFLMWADRYNPDILWLHNIHGYYINYEILFEWIKRRQKELAESGKPAMEVKWTLHDCWAFTGHCAYFSYVGCDKWKCGCGDCPQKCEYPQSIIEDYSSVNYLRKKGAFQGVNNLEILVPSEWMKKLAEDSFLGQYHVTVLNNSIDNSIFKYTESNFREKYNLENKIVVLGVAYVWDKRKGLNTFIELSKMLNDDFAIVLVGLNQKQIAKLPKGIIGLPRTEKVEKLVEIYSSADVFVNPSYEETFGMTTMEAQACGTYTIVYKGTACEEVSVGEKGCSVLPGADNLRVTIHSIFKKEDGNN